MTRAAPIIPKETSSFRAVGAALRRIVPWNLIRRVRGPGSLAKLNALTCRSGVRVWQWDIQGNSLQFSDDLIDLVGADAAEAGNDPGELMLRCVHPDDRERFQREMSAALRCGTRFNIEHRVLLKDGSVRAMQLRGEITRSAGGDALRMLGIAIDMGGGTEDVARIAEQNERQNHSLRRLKLATQSAGISVWEQDLVTGDFEDDGTFFKLFGLEPVAKFKPAHGIHTDERREKLAPLLELGENSNSNANEILTLRNRTSNPRPEPQYVQTHIRVYRDAVGMPIRLLGVTWDVTEEVLHAAQLERSAAEARALMERLGVATQAAGVSPWEYDLVAGRFSWCGTRLPCFGLDEIPLDEYRIGLYKIVVDADRAIVHGAWRAAVAAKSDHYEYTFRVHGIDGEIHHIHDYARLLRSADGELSYMVGVTRDISRDIAANELLKSQADENRRLIDQLNMATESAGIASWDIDLIALRFTSIENPLKSLQMSAEEYGDLDKFALRLLPEDRTKLRGAIQEALENGRDKIRFRYRFLGEHDTLVHVQLMGRVLLDENKTPVRVIGVSYDVSDEVTASNLLLRATEDAQAASRAKNQFLANVSHEIRTPMNGIIGMTGLLQDTPLDRTQREYAETIRSSADSLLTVINDILDFSKIEAGKLDLESIEMDLRANVEDVGAMMAFQAASKGLELIVNVHPDVASSVLGDPQRLRQCIVNLVSNAIKFTNTGEIVIEVRPEQGADGRPLTYFEVSDTGMGIPAQILATLFQPFVQADASTTRHFGGTGLGLSIVRHLVELMGGHVGVSSEVGKGSRFYFSLPLRTAEPMLPPAPVRSGETGRILVVDDNLTNQKVLSSLLAHAGYEVAATGTARSALLQLEAATSDGEPFDMVITDYQMPEMDGAALGERIVNTPTLSDTRLVMLTSLDRHGDTPRLSALGFAAYLSKPVRGKELLQAVTKVMSGEPRQWQMDTQPMITRNTLALAATQQRFAGHVLLVEDNLVNQKVAARFLERLGCTVEVAGNGAEGVSAATARQFDIILMDLQMPVMDGITATKRIRALEALRQTPIIALTANAMTGDRERCEAAGMDDYLTKPIEVERLRATLTKYGLAVPESAAPAGATAAGAAAPQENRSGTTGNLRPPIDLRALNELIDGDADFARDLAATFIDSGELQLADMQRAAAGGHREALAKAAHKLAGACASIHAHSLQAMVHRLETDSKTAVIASLEAALTRARQEFDRTKQFLSDPDVIAPKAKAAS